MAPDRLVPSVTADIAIAVELVQVIDVGFGEAAQHQAVSLQEGGHWPIIGPALSYQPGDGSASAGSGRRADGD
jgi:hypothetical protein